MKQIKNNTKKEVLSRDCSCCVICSKFGSIEGFPMPGIDSMERLLEETPHHCFFKSEYFDDNRNDAWNLVTICIFHHRVIHRPTPHECGFSKICRGYCKTLAKLRKPTQPVGTFKAKKAKRKPGKRAKAKSTNKQTQHNNAMKKKYPFMK